MKPLLSIIFSLVLVQAFSQDYIKKTDGTVIKGEAKSLENNIFTMQTTDNQSLSFNVNELSKIHISREGFKMNNLNLNNSRFETGDDGITITLGEEAMNGNRESRNKSGSYSSSGKGSSSSSAKNSSSTESISSEDDNATKASVIFECKICDKKGKLQLESQDGTASASWAFSTDEGESAFPHKMKLDANKTFDWSYHDKKNGWKTGSLKLKAGETLTFIIVENR